MFEPQVVLYDPKTLDKLPELQVMEHYLLLGSTIRSKKEEYAKGGKHHEEWKPFIRGLSEAQLLMEDCHAVKKDLKEGGAGWYGVPQMELEQSYGRLDTLIKR